MFIVYQLALVNYKHYFGTTPAWRKYIRMQEHISGAGSKWTRRFPPLPMCDSVIRTWDFKTRDEAYAFEDKKCCEFLNRYGIDSTRGGLQNADLGVPYKYWVRPHLQHLVPYNVKTHESGTDPSHRANEAIV